MPTPELKQIAKTDSKDWSLRDCSHTLFFLLPNSAILAQKAHADWNHFKPLIAGSTEISVTILIPMEADLADQYQ